MAEESELEKQDNNVVDFLEVLNSVITSLQKLSKEERDRSIQMILTFFNFGSVTTPRSEGFERPRPIGGGLPTFSEDRTMSPKEFIMSKQPQTDVERVACLAYYLSHFRDTPHFKTIDISKLNTEAAQRKFANATKSVNNATTYGYLAAATKGQKQLSGAGELFVQALPDRDTAKEAIRVARPKRKLKVAKKIAEEKKLS